MMLDPLYDVHNPKFTGTIFRKNEDDIMQNGGLWDKAKILFPCLGGEERFSGKKFIFPSGSQINFSQLNNESTKIIESRFKGLEMPFIAIDEIDQIRFTTVKKLLESNRNSQGLRNRFLGSCNPSCDTWLRKWVDWYLDDDGYVIPERDGVIRYFFLNGESVDDVVWGNSKDEVYHKCKGIMDGLLLKMNEGVVEEEWTTTDQLIKDFVFIEGSLSENKKLTDADPMYKANIAMGTDEDRQRNILGCWNISRTNGNAMVSVDKIEEFFENVEQTTGQKYMSIDVAMGGNDQAVIVIWDGLHVIDVVAKLRIDTPSAFKSFVEPYKNRYNIREDNIYYDEIGVGAILKDYKRAYGINAGSKCIDDDSFDKLKSQLMWQFGSLMKDNKLSIAPNLLEKKFDCGKRGSLTLREIVMHEMKALKIMDTAGKTKMLPKNGSNSMKSILGHSPDFLEALAYGVVHTLGRKKGKPVIKGLGYL